MSIRAWLRDHPWPKRIVLALAALWLLYLAVANGLLASHQIERAINGSTHDVELHFGRAFSLWPGRVHVDDFSLRVNDGNVQALLTVESADTWVDLWPLARRRVRLHRTAASGARFWLRHRVAAIDAENAPRIAAYPPIPGVEPPLFSTEPSPPPPAPDTLWQVSIDDGEAFGTELWIQEFRYRGLFHGTGGFALWPLVEFTLHPTQGSLLPGTLHIGEREVTKDLSIDLQLQMARFEVPKVLGTDPLRGLDAHAEIQLQAADGAFLEAYRPLGLPHVTFSGATLRIAADFHEQHFTERTSAQLTFDAASLHTPGLALDGPLQLELQGRPHGHLDGSVATRGLVVTVPALGVAGSRAWRIEAASIHGDGYLELDHPPAFTLGAGRGTVVIPSLDWVGRLSAGRLQAGGALVTRIDAKPSEHGDYAGTLDSTLDDVQITGGELAMATRGTLRGAFAIRADASAASFTHLVLDLPAFTLRSGTATRSSWVKAKLPTVTATRTPALAVQGQLELEVGSSSLLAVPLASSIVARYLQAGPANLRGAVRLGSGGYDLELERGRVGVVEATGFVKKVGSGPFGAFLVSTSGLSVGVGIDAGGFSLHPLSGPAWVQAQRAKAR